MNGVLLSCLGHPYSVPIAQDPIGTRRLLNEDEWILSISGNNVCKLEGKIILGTTTEMIDIKNLYVNGTRWEDGGLDKARKLILASTEPSILEEKPSQ